MVKKKTIVIVGVILAVAGVTVAFLAMGAVNYSVSRTAAADLAKQISPVNANQPPAVEEKIRWLLNDDPDRVNDIDWRQSMLDIIVTGNTGDTAKLIVHSDSAWHGSIYDSDGTAESVSGRGATDFHCGDGGTFAATVQLRESIGTLDITVAQAGRILEQGNTGISYGVVSVAGSCA